ncbi:hypothetical protein BDZ97DRAFT_1707220 [Flammula alnicola]|nr:hypothetical protein BDZ97DRAFT_1707220 [Flammula alnicola]
MNPYCRSRPFGFCAIPGLTLAAKTLLNIWDAAQYVDVNESSRISTLTERCADILLSVREEIYEAGDQVGLELAAPISKLEEAYTNVYRFMLKQTNRPWLKRYLRRDEILRDIAACDSMLRDALGLFGISIQIRILKQVQETEKRREHETQTVLKAILHGNRPPPNSELTMITGTEVEVVSPEPSPYVLSSDFSTETVTEFATTRNALGLIEGSAMSPTELTPARILPALETIHTVQNSLDAARDTSDLRQLMRVALQTSSDAEMLEVLQIGRQEMPDAIKTLQRALERLSERDGESLESSIIGNGVVTGKITRKVSVKEVDGLSGEGNTTLERSETTISVDSSSSSVGSMSGGSSTESKQRDTLDWEFIETGIDCLRRMSRGVETAVPSWTITKYEVDRDDKIGVGFFSDVYKGMWRGRCVAIKVLAETTPRNLFVREIEIWKQLRHPNVLPLYGASSATGDPPWFFVSPYLKNGTLVEHLKRIEQDKRPSGLGVGIGANIRSSGWRSVTLPGPYGLTPQTPNPPPSLSPPLAANRDTLTPPALRKTPLHDSNDVQREWDLFRFMHEIAKGMEYLHANGVLHGDLKASNVLVDNKYRSVISDFGQSEMKSEAFRISGIPPPHGTLRWQSPEFMSGQCQLTPAVDVWAFSISCVEILTMGRMPWPMMDDNAVRHFVLKDDTRPPMPKYSRFNTPRLQEILRSCWQTDPEKRPTFIKIARELKLLRKSYGHSPNDSPRLPPIEDLPEPPSSPSPDMRPKDNLPQYVQDSGPIPLPDVLGESFTSLRETTMASDTPHHESTIATPAIKMPEPVFYTPASSRSSSVHIGRSEEHINVIPSDDGYDSPPPMDERVAQIRNERRYRLLLTHDHNPSLTLPLWQPTPVELGAVGYLSKPEGIFVTLFNAFNPRASDHPGIQSLPSIYGYGAAKDGIQRLPKKTVAQKALDMIIGSLTFRNTAQSIVRRVSFPLKAGHKAAYLYTESTEYRYMETLDAPRMWFQSHVDTIMQIYGHQSHITKEDLFLIIGTLRTQNYALMVSHYHPEGHAHFNVYSNPKPGQPWGTFTTDNEVPHELGPAYDLDEPDERPRSAESKVSKYNDPWEAVLLARLRFKPDAIEPTSK